MKKKKFNLFSVLVASILGWGGVMIVMMLLGHDYSDSWDSMAIGFITYVLTLSVLLYFKNKI